MKWTVGPSSVQGSVTVPGDKSIAHRAVIAASLADGISHIRGLPHGQDVQSTVRCVCALGADVHYSEHSVRVSPPDALKPPQVDLDAGNSGTTIRLLSGVLAGQRFQSRLTGDDSLCRRPMRRVISPLELMGATIEAQDDKPPLLISGSPLTGCRYTLPVASAQVKSAILLAGLFAEGLIEIREPIPTRDHTERMFRALDVEVGESGRTISMVGGQKLRSFDLTIPGDMSSAAFLFAAATLTNGSVEVRDVGVNPTRTSFLTVLQKMGARVTVTRHHDELGEPVATVRVDGIIHRAIHLTDVDIPSLIDEIPLIALLATQADGTSTIRGAGELRVKETDRVSAVAHVLRAMGANLEEFEDGFAITGATRLLGASVHSFGDHRIAMMAAVAGLVSSGETRVDGAEAAAVSYPGFRAALQALGARIVDG